MAETHKGQEPSSALEWIQRLIQIDTISRNSNLGLIETARDYLRGLGLECWLTFDSAGGKANLCCSIPDVNGHTAGGVVLSGHTDVVPVAGQDWDSDPFVPTLHDGKLYGRGAADMKSFIGIVLAQVPHLLQHRLGMPVHLALSFDEEVGCLGVPLLLRGFTERGIRPTGCIVGEPTNMQLVVAHKGFSAHRCKLTGQATHSSLPASGVNAAEYAAQLISFIRSLADEVRSGGPFDAAFDVPYSTAQTISVTGGGVLNTVPDYCEVEFTLRHLPQVDPERFFERVHQYASAVLLPEMRQNASDCDVRIVFERIVSVPGFEAQEAAPFTHLMHQLTGDGVIRKVAYATEAGLFQHAGIPTVVCGPGDIQQAHRKNEYIQVEQIQRCEKFLSRLTQQLVIE